MEFGAINRYSKKKQGKAFLKRKSNFVEVSESKKLPPFKNPCIIHHLFNKECDGLKWVTSSNGLDDNIND